MNADNNRCYGLFLGSFLDLRACVKGHNSNRRGKCQLESAEWRVSRTPLIPTAETAATLTGGGKSLLVEMIEATDLHTGSRPRASGMGRVATEHRDTRAKLGPAEGNHVFPIERFIRFLHTESGSPAHGWTYRT